MTEKEYRQHPAVSRSELWRLDDSPEKFKYYRDHPPDPTPSLLFGQVVHKLLLQPDDFDTDFVVIPYIDRRTKAGKEEYAAFCEGVGDRSAVPYEMYITAVIMSQKALTVPLVRDLLNGEKETPFFWTDEDTGEACKCRTDCLTVRDGQYVIVDYKTAGSAKTDMFNHSVFKWGYHFQSAMYAAGVMAAKDLDYLPEFVFIVQEKTPPYAVNVVSVSPEVQLAGMDKFRELIGIYHECKITGFWYGYNGALDEPNETYLPGYLQLGVEEDE